MVGDTKQSTWAIQDVLATGCHRLRTPEPGMPTQASPGPVYRFPSLRKAETQVPIDVPEIILSSSGRAFEQLMPCNCHNRPGAPKWLTCI